MAQLAIKGHATHGKEVIDILEMLGGKNNNKLKGTNTEAYFFMGLIEPEIFLAEKHKLENITFEEFMFFTLEEFLEKFPYKIKDKVISHNKWIGEIISAEWCNDDVVYYIRENNGFISHHHTNELQPYKEQKAIPPYMDYDITTTYEEMEKTMIKIPEFPQSINLSQSNVNEIEVVLGDYEFILKDGKTYFVKKKPQYPKTYDECCEVLDILGNINIEGYKEELLLSLQQLLICRDAYWKLAGEQMGLGKPWEPDWNDVCDKYTIYIVYGNEIWRDKGQTINTLLAFPTMEMRDTFYNNFKELIEECKELL